MIYLTLLLISAITGISSGMFGIGGSVIASPLLLLLTDISPNAALSTPLPVAFSSAISGSILYIKEKLVDFKLSILTILFALPFSTLGSYLTTTIDVYWLLAAKAMFLLILGIRFFLSKEKKYQPNENRKILNIAYTGALAGFIAGILALGGGIVFVTAYIKLLKIDLKTAIATSLFNVGILALINSIEHYLLGSINIHISIIMMVLVVPFAFLGAFTSVRLKNKTLTFTFGILLIIFAIYTMINLF